MDGRFNNPFISEQEDPLFTLDMDDSSPPIKSPKRSKRAVQKRVVSVPIGDVDNPRLKGGEGAPPSDSWAWRKYGQKPIKGSPYPRGYYRCSSSKGCPARKQVERSRVDPTMLVITYACDHNHTGPTSKSSNLPVSPSSTSPESDKSSLNEPNPFSIRIKPEPDLEPEPQYSDQFDEPLITSDDFGWFSDVASTSPTVFDSPLYTGNSDNDADMAMIFKLKEEDELLFADLEELPECSLVFRRGFIVKEEEHRRCNLRTSLCESTG
ncbi:WRKY Transcription Factor [Ranunculus cassubicifolius]